jgi:hypothetical protein
MSRESIILSQVRDYCKVLGIRCRRNNTGSVRRGKRTVVYGTAGEADLTLFFPGGKVIHCETKATDGKLSEAQMLWINEQSALGYDTWVVRSIEEFVEMTKGVKK